MKKRSPIGPPLGYSGRPKSLQVEKSQWGAARGLFAHGQTRLTNSVTLSTMSKASPPLASDWRDSTKSPKRLAAFLSNLEACGALAQ